MKKPIKRAAVIHDLCGVGKAALTNILPVLSMMEIEVCPVPTMILSSHTGGLGTPVIVKLDNYIEKAMNHYGKLNLDFDGIFIGYLGDIKNIEECINYFEELDRNRLKNNIEEKIVIFDPIFGDNGVYYSNFDKKYSEKLKQLIKYAHIITPNYTEACLLSETEFSDYVEREEIHKICRRLCKYGCRNVVITSVPLKDKSLIGTAVYDRESDLLNIIESVRQEKSYPGTGDIFTSVLFGSLMNGKSLLNGCERSCSFVEKTMKISSQYDYEVKEGVLLEKCLKYLNE
ncbi:pyridoxamine kinase [uncultured Clostridium sp.]|uniref:pyridoxamine kinase n=1 Tax=uncultured Clostridium sp. TaxID=59620 RepID=UPI0025DD2ED7|nr:pyridoxamine kinase [uncultured Clostridium sp.]